MLGWIGKIQGRKLRDLSSIPASEQNSHVTMGLLVGPMFIYTMETGSVSPTLLLKHCSEVKMVLSHSRVQTYLFWLEKLWAFWFFLQKE